jgi:hypothetical protein
MRKINKNKKNDEYISDYYNHNINLSKICNCHYYWIKLIIYQTEIDLN